MEQDTRPEQAPMLATPRKAAAADDDEGGGGGGGGGSSLQLPSAARARATCAQCAVAGAVFLLSAGCGFPIGFSAVALPQLREPNSTLPTDADMGSWIASVHSAATPVGAFLSGLLSERVGRRTALQLTALPFVLGWALVALASSHALILAGRLFCGFAVGLSAAPSQVLISEVCEPRTRGALAGTPMVSYSLGIVCVYVLGALLPWRVVAWLGTGLPLCALCALALMPESPTWLARRGRLAPARDALRWLRGGPAAHLQAERELQQLVARAREEEEAETAAAAASGDGDGDGGGGCLRAFAHPHVYKPFLIVTVLNFLQIFSGTYLVIFYAVDLIAQADAGMDEFMAAVLTAAVRLVFTALACGLLSWTGRRPLALTSGVAAGLAAVAMGTALYLRDGLALSERGDPDPFPAVIVGCLLVYMAANTCGFFVLPLITIGELLPAKVRGLAGGYIFATFNLGLFAVTKVFPRIATEIGAHGVFWVFGMSSLAGTVFIYMALPETKGKSLAEIEDYFKGRNFFWVTRHKHQSQVSAKA